MNDLVIKTENLTKIYGEQKAVKSVNLHVKRGVSMGCLDVTEQERQRL